MRADVEKVTCISCGLCESICPDVFIIEGDGKATVKENPVPAASEESTIEAEKSCPVDAINVILEK